MSFLLDEINVKIWFCFCVLEWMMTMMAMLLGVNGLEGRGAKKIIKGVLNIYFSNLMHENIKVSESIEVGL
jgi:hypothetical protein